MSLKAVAGLGNPGARYKGTRHNIGFMVLDELANRYSLQWKTGFQGEYCAIAEFSNKLFLLKPMTYMNLSGNSVGELCSYYKIDPEELMVVHDELDFSYGKLKIRQGGSAAGHNGVTSVSSHMGQSYYRLRMGVAGMSRSEIRGYSAEYVLASFTSEERKTLADFVSLGADAVEHTFKEDIQKAMQKYNQSTD